MFKTRRKSYFSSRSSYRPYGKSSPRPWRLFVIIPCLLLGLELLLRLGINLTGQTDALHHGGASTITADYRLAYGDTSGKIYKNLAHPGRLAVRRSPLLGYELLTNQSGKHWNINAQGFRSPLLDETKATDELRIFILGGSTAFGQLSSSDQTTITYLLEAQLNGRVRKQQKAPNQFRPLQLPYYADEQAIALAKPKRIREKRYRVINAAVPGYISSNELSQFVHHVSRYQPDILVLVNGYTDLFVPSEQIASDIPQIDSTLNNARAHFAQSLQTGLGLFFNRFYLIKVPRQYWLSKPVAQSNLEYLFHLRSEISADKLEMQRRTKRYAENLADLARLSSGAEIPLIVAIQPKISDRFNHNPTFAEQKILKRLDRDYPQQMEAAYQQLRQSIEKIKKLYPNVSSLSLDNLYDKTQTDVFQDPIHLTDEANQILAEKLYGVLAKQLEINPEPNTGEL